VVSALGVGAASSTGSVFLVPRPTFRAASGLVSTAGAGALGSTALMAMGVLTAFTFASGSGFALDLRAGAAFTGAVAFASAAFVLGFAAVAGLAVSVDF